MGWIDIIDLYPYNSGVCVYVMKVYLLTIQDLNDGSKWTESAFSEQYYAEAELEILKPIFGIHYKLEVIEMIVVTAYPVKIEKECM